MPAPSRSQRGAQVEVLGLPELRRDLRDMQEGPRWVRELGQSQREIAKKAAGWSKFEAQGMGGPFAHFAGAIKGRGGATGARVSVGDPAANATFWGAKKRTGWFGSGRYSGHDSQHPRWVGNSWDVGDLTQGPYAINRAIGRHFDDIDEMYREAVDRVMDSAKSYRTSTF